MKTLRWLAALAAVVGLSAPAHAQPSSTTGAVAPQECLVAEVIADLCGPKLLGIRIAITDGATATECGNLGDAGLGAFENLCRWSDVATAWVSDDVAGFGGGGTHPIAAGDYGAGSIDDADINVAAAIASSKLADDVLVEADAGDGLEVTAGQLNTKSDEEGFLEDLGAGDLICGVGTEGKFAINNADPPQWCNSDAPPIRKTAAYGNDAGQVTDFSQANDLDASGTVNGTHAGTAHHTVFGPNASPSSDHSSFDSEVDARITAADVLVEADVGDGLEVAGGQLNTKSDETGFINSIGAGPIACGAGTFGKVALSNFDVLEYCDANVAEAHHYVADADSSGLVTDFSNAADLDAAGDVANASHTHTVVNLSDTSATAGELDTVTNGSNADAEHSHAALNPPPCAVAIDLPETTDDIFCGKADSALTLVELCCTSTGSTTPLDLIMTVYECHPFGHTCVSSGLSVELDLLLTNYCDSVGTDYAIDDGDWWGVFTDSVGTAPDTVQCSLEFSR